jgi:hypothetical protein
MKKAGLKFECRSLFDEYQMLNTCRISGTSSVLFGKLEGVMGLFNSKSRVARIEYIVVLIIFHGNEIFV